jgi:hypothetical protein
MRILMAMALVCVASCATEELAQAPPAGVDLTGHWKLNEADSDDPQRLLLAQNAADSQSNAPGGSGGGGGGGGGGGRGGRGGGRGGGAMGMGAGPGGPAMPSASVMAEGVRWPGKQLEIRQIAGVVAFTSDGGSVVCQPMGGGAHHGHHGDSADGNGWDAQSRSRDAPPPRCGWMEKILIVENRESEDEHPPFEEHFGLSEDSRRLVEVVEFKGGRSSGFTMSRVWDRADQ